MISFFNIVCRSQLLWAPPQARKIRYFWESDSRTHQRRPIGQLVAVKRKRVYKCPSLFLMFFWIRTPQLFSGVRSAIGSLQFGSAKPCTFTWPTRTEHARAQHVNQNAKTSVYANGEVRRLVFYMHGDSECAAGWPSIHSSKSLYPSLVLGYITG